MIDDETDNPYAPPESIEDKSVKKEIKPVKWFQYVHIALVVWAALMFFDCFGLLFLESHWIDRQNIASLIFSVGYIGLFFRQKWAYWAVALVVGSWIMQFIIDRNHRNIIIYFGLMVILSVICALTCRRQRK